MKNIFLAFAILTGLMFVGCGEEKTATSTSSDEKVVASVPSDAEPIEIEGFLTTKWCLGQGMFQDCRMESVVCGEGECYKEWEFGDKEKMNLVIYNHKEMKYYNIQPSKEFHLAELIETSMSRDMVTIKGQYDAKNNILLATEFEAPPPPVKSFFKGCL